MAEVVKLIILDLDGTLWDGILLEDGPDRLRPRAEMLEPLRALIEGGVLLSICSRNHWSEVEPVLASHQISDLFVFPQVSFQPKSEGVARILRSVRFDPKACVFVDDSAFERAEVQAAFPELTVLSPEEFPAFCRGERIRLERSEEAKSRTRFYQEEEQRVYAEEAFAGTFREFLSDSGLEVRMGRPSTATIDRIVEIVQRTNQINFSTNRYSRTEVELLLEAPDHRSYVVSARDRFGAYGLIGFASVRLEAPSGTGGATIHDLMLSCRIQGRGVESAIIATLARLMKRDGRPYLRGLYRPTRRNGHISSVYRNLGFVPDGEEGEFQCWRLPLEGTLPEVPSHIRFRLSEKVADEVDEGIPFVRQVVERHARNGLLAGELLDIGAGWDGVLGEGCDTWLEGGGARHIRLDLFRYPKTDLVANAQHMPEVHSEHYPAVLCLEVLEHCTQPFDLASELLRVLKPSGVAIVSAPMNYVIHDHPGDFWRFTPDGLKLLFAQRADVLEESVEGEADHPTRTVLVLKKR